MPTEYMHICTGLECADVTKVYRLLDQACLNVSKGISRRMGNMMLCGCRCQLGLPEVTTRRTDCHRSLSCWPYSRQKSLYHLPALLNTPTAAVHLDQA